MTLQTIEHQAHADIKFLQSFIIPGSLGTAKYSLLLKYYGVAPSQIQWRRIKLLLEPSLHGQQAIINPCQLIVNAMHMVRDIWKIIYTCTWDFSQACYRYVFCNHESIRILKKLGGSSQLLLMSTSDLQ